jgi:hypothetical protein
MASGEVPGVMSGIWEEPAAGASGEDVPVGGNYHPDGRYRTARYVTRRSGGCGRGEAARPFPIPIRQLERVFHISTRSS